MYLRVSEEGLGLSRALSDPATIRGVVTGSAFRFGAEINGTLCQSAWSKLRFVHRPHLLDAFEYNVMGTSTTEMK